MLISCSSPLPQYTFKQRYFSYDKYFKPGGPIFFYFGNEDYVDLYVNHTGLMWENAEEFGAMLVSGGWCCCCWCCSC